MSCVAECMPHSEQSSVYSLDAYYVAKTHLLLDPPMSLHPSKCGAHHSAPLSAHRRDAARGAAGLGAACAAVSLEGGAHNDLRFPVAAWRAGGAASTPDRGGARLR
eukprot:1288731-Pleurochrysis_carterae.AAC.2